MPLPIQLQLLFAIYFILEAWLEKPVIDMKNVSIIGYDQLNKKEHFRSGMLAAWIISGTTILVFHFHWATFIMSASLFINRRLFFDYSLKIFRNKKIADIEGDGIVDILSRQAFGRKGGYWEIGACLLYIYLLTKYGILLLSRAGT